MEACVRAAPLTTLRISNYFGVWVRRQAREPAIIGPDLSPFLEMFGSTSGATRPPVRRSFLFRTLTTSWAALSGFGWGLADPASPIAPALPPPFDAGVRPLQ